MALPFAAIAGALGAATGLAKVVGGFFGKKAILPGALGGAGVSLLLGGDGKPKRRRRRKRLTNTEIQELLILKQIVGTRSPLLTIAGLKMLSRGG